MGFYEGQPFLQAIRSTGCYVLLTPVKMSGDRNCKNVAILTHSVIMGLKCEMELF